MIRSDPQPARPLTSADDNPNTDRTWIVFRSRPNQGAIRIGSILRYALG
jgi:hypothetical protein